MRYKRGRAVLPFPIREQGGFLDVLALVDPIAAFFIDLAQDLLLGQLAEGIESIGGITATTKDYPHRNLTDNPPLHHAQRLVIMLLSEWSTLTS
ncbi:hypothetical protein P4B35_20400 [Pontiellaceae bacterium B12227]|nr:hypothetical protein [Pontiellaceae bacterium B12227]